MKKLLCLCYCFMICLSAFSQNEDSRLIGMWTAQKTYHLENVDDKMQMSEVLENGVLEFKANGTVIAHDQSSSQEASWKLNGNSLVIGLDDNNKQELFISFISDDQIIVSNMDMSGLTIIVIMSKK